MKVLVAKFDAVGGPRNSRMGGDNFMAGPTDKGKFVVAYCAKHSSHRYAFWSKIKWGTPLKEERGHLYVKMAGKWQKLSLYTGVTKSQILDAYHDLYGVRKLPDKWVFNDFGHMTCYYFKDTNENGRLDTKRGERIHGEFIHTTPIDEANTAQNKPVLLTESHGCVHVKPKDIDIMIRRGYLKRKNLFIVHGYSEKTPTTKVDTGGRRPYEVHFYPRSKKILVYGTK